MARPEHLTQWWEGVPREATLPEFFRYYLLPRLAFFALALTVLFGVLALIR